MRPAFNRLRSNRSAQSSPTPSLHESPLHIPPVSVGYNEKPLPPPPAKQMHPVHPLDALPISAELPHNDTIARYHAYLKDKYTPQEIQQRLSSRAPANSDDIHILHLAAGYANLWCTIDRDFQSFIREEAHGMDFCTLTSTIHAMLSKLVRDGL